MVFERNIPRMGWVVVFLIVVMAVVFSYLNVRRGGEGGTVEAFGLSRYAKAPDFEFLAHDGTKLGIADLLGKVWVANFVFTRCQGPCPRMTALMRRIQDALKRAGYEDVRLVTVTVDPDYDTPELLARYAGNVGADATMWKFVTGPRAQVERVVRKGFLQRFGTDHDGGLVHSTRFVVVDRDGWIRAFQDGEERIAFEKILLDIRDLRNEGSVGDGDKGEDG